MSDQEVIPTEVLEFEPVKGIAPDPGKLQSLLRSRRFWTVVLSIATAIAVQCFGFEADQVDRLNQVIMVVAGVYIGGLSLEDALKQLHSRLDLTQVLGVLADRFKQPGP